MRYIVISKGTELVRIPSQRLVYVSSDGNYSRVVTQDNREFLVVMQLGQVEELVARQLEGGRMKFLRLGRGLIINIDFLCGIDISKKQLVLSDCLNCYHELSASRDVLVKLKQYVESNNELNL